MKNIWTVRFDTKNFATASLVEQDEGEGILDISEFCPDWPDFEGQKIGKAWKMFRAELDPEKQIGNFTDIDPGVLICDAFALSNIGEAISEEVEVLPIQVDKLEMNVLNVINIIDCLDESKSEIEYFSDGGVASIKRYSFYTNPLIGVMLFKIPQFSRTEIYANDAFRDLVINTNLTGLDFQNVFHSAIA
ncbi:MAG: hypothetical protein KME12_09335 [Trichocoleus desertorum ATA4-8-CV12]|jgi:hypothetical protein|nr:hypothetical protein [Trichocoleus desertorum ATA4-8-CV12]